MSDENLMGVVAPAPDAQENAATEAPDTAAEAHEDEPERTFTQAELDKIVQRAKARADRRADRESAGLREQIAKLSEAINELRTKPQANATDATQSAPKREQFDSYEDFIEAKAEWKALERVRSEFEQREKRETEAKTKQTQEQHQREFQKATAARIDAGRKAYADFDAVINEAFDDGVIPAGSALHFALVEDDAGHELAYHLAKNPDEAERIAALPERSMLRELGKLAVKLGDKKPAKRDAPIDPIGNRAAPGTALRNDLPMDEWVKRREAQIRKGT